jgi:hypothetical protein
MKIVSEPYESPNALIQSIHRVRDDMERLRADLKNEKQTTARLLFLLCEEKLANGGQFHSMETDVLFKRFFWSETDTNHTDVLERLTRKYKPQA